MRFKKASIASVVVGLLFLIWVGFIFYMSSQTAVNSGQMSQRVTSVLIKVAEKIGVLTEGSSNYPYLVQKYDSTVRSLAHMGMYFLLCLIISLVLKLYGVKKWAYKSFAVCFAISILDELNQMRYKGRNDSGQVHSGIEDLFKDIFGTIAALLVALFIINLINWLRNKKRAD